GSPPRPRTCTIASSAASATARSDGCVAMHLSLVPRIAFVRLMPTSEEHPDPGSRLLHGVATSRKYGQRVRCRILPAIVAMLRTWPDAASSSDWLTSG